MLYTKKTLAMLLASIVLGGGAWYLNTSGVLDGLSSSVFGNSFVCSEENLKTQAKEYRQNIIQQRRANTYRDELEATIIALRDVDKINEMKQQQKKLRTLIRGIGAYNRFIKSYSTCQKKIQSMSVTTPQETAPVLNTAPVDGFDASREIGTSVVPTLTVTVPSTDTIPSVVIPSNPGTVETPVTTIPPVVIIPETTEPPVTIVSTPSRDEEIPETTQTPSDTDSAQV